MRDFLLAMFVVLLFVFMALSTSNSDKKGCKMTKFNVPLLNHHKELKERLWAEKLECIEKLMSLEDIFESRQIRDRINFINEMFQHLKDENFFHYP